MKNNKTPHKIIQHISVNLFDRVTIKETFNWKLFDQSEDIDIELRKEYGKM